MKRYILLSFCLVLSFSSCEKFKTDAVTGREFLLRKAPRTQRFGPGVTEFTGERGMSFSVFGNYRSIATNEVIEGDVTFYLREFKDIKDMLYAGLVTQSEGLVIATSGAFQLRAEIDGTPVKPQEILFHIPSNSLIEDTQVFFGSTDSISFWAIEPPNFIFTTTGVVWADTNLLGNPQSGYQGFLYPQSYFFENGWMSINCDHFLGEGLPLTDVRVRPSAEAEFNSIQLSVSMLFETENSYLNGIFDNQSDSYVFYNVPIGYEVSCLGVGVDNNQDLYFGLVTFEIEENGVYTFNLEPITEQDLEDILDGL